MKSLSENGRGLSPFSESAEKKGTVPLFADGFRIGSKWHWRLVAIAALIGSGFVASRRSAGADEAPKALVLAKVNGKAIFDLEIDRALAALKAAAPAAEKSDAALRAAVLNQLIDRRLVETALEQAHQAVTPEEIDLEVTRLKTELARSKQTLDQFLAKAGQTELIFRAELAWQLTWQHFMKQRVTDEAIDTYFKARHRDFDGTELRVSHVLFRPMAAGDEAAVATLVKEAAEVRRQILAGEIKFADAAEKYSAGPSRQKGGDLGFIPRHGVMAEPFARAAFALEKGDVSPPVATVFGIHLITVTEVKPGEKKLAELHDAVRAALAEQLYNDLATRERSKAKIEFIGKAPHFKPGTPELVVPGP
jgi:parvulin-like peptidyl-prolyl isomerase